PSAGGPEVPRRGAPAVRRDRVSAVTVTIAAEHPALAGHFPGAPILPGVLLLDERLRAVEQERPCAGMRWRIGAAKFVKPVRPGETLTLEHEPLPNGSIAFRIASAGQAVAHGVLVPAIAPTGPHDARGAAVPAGPRVSAAQWADAPERGSATLLRIMIFLSLRLGRPVARCLLHLIAAYFFAFAPGARRSSRQYLRRALGAMLRIRDCLDAGKFVGMLADRTIAAAPAQLVSFLGRAALFPSGPMRAAAALRRPVIFMTGLYRGGNHYHVVFRQIADFSRPEPAGREAAVRDAVARYVALLEAHCRSDPYNWFNFYDFWHGADGGETASARGVIGVPRDHP